jgi:hypothetical protein
VQVVRHHGRLHVQHAAQVRHGLLQRLAGGGVVQAADVRRQEGLRAARQAHGVLQPAAGGQHRRAAARQRDGPRREAACAADELRRAAGQRAQHAVVAARDDVAVVQQPGVGQALQALQRFGVVAHQRFAAGVGAGHHQQQILRLLQPAGAGGAAGGLVEEQELDRRAGQHQAQGLQAGATPGSGSAGVGSALGAVMPATAGV